MFGFGKKKKKQQELDQLVRQDQATGEEQVASEEQVTGEEQVASEEQVPPCQTIKEQEAKKKKGRIDKLIFGAIIGAAVGSVIGMTIAPKRDKKIIDTPPVRDKKGFFARLKAKIFDNSKAVKKPHGKMDEKLEDIFKQIPRERP